MTDDERIAEIRARLDAITPGKWNIPTHRRFPEFGYDVATDHPRTDLNGDRGLMLRREEDAAFIAHAPADICALLADNAALRARVAELEDLCCKALDGIDEYWCTLPENENTMKELFLLNKAKGRPLEMGQGMFDTKKRLFPDESEATE